MFNDSMSLSEMDEIIFYKGRNESITLEELVKMMSESDLAIYLDTYKKEKGVTEADLIWMDKVGANAFYIASELQIRW